MLQNSADFKCPPHTCTLYEAYSRLHGGGGGVWTEVRMSSHMFALTELR